jgi:hypothetical protein
VRDVTFSVSLVEMGQNSFHFNRKQKSELVMTKPSKAEIEIGLNLLLVYDRPYLTWFVNEVTPVLRLTRHVMLSSSYRGSFLVSVYTLTY